MKVYIVEGTCGEYADVQQWLVSAHKNVESAEAKIDLLTAKLEEFGLDRSLYGQEYSDAYLKMRDFDPLFCTDYTGTIYDYYEMELEE